VLDQVHAPALVGPLRGKRKIIAARDDADVVGVRKQIDVHIASSTSEAGADLYSALTDGRLVEVQSSARRRRKKTQPPWVPQPRGSAYTAERGAAPYARAPLHRPVMRRQRGSKRAREWHCGERAYRSPPRCRCAN